MTPKAETVIQPLKEIQVPEMPKPEMPKELPEEEPMDPVTKAELDYILKLKQAPLEDLFKDDSHDLREQRQKSPLAEDVPVLSTAPRFPIRKEDILWIETDE